MSADTELVLLRAMYIAWTEFHSIKRDRLHRRQHELAAQDLVDAHNALKLFYEQHAKPALALVASNGEVLSTEAEHAGA